MNTKALLIGASIGVLALGSLSYAAINGKGPRAFDETIKTAIESNNYAALSDSAKAKITQEKFNSMLAKKTQHDAVQNAIESGDYGAFKNAMIAQIPTETEFQEMVARHKEHLATQAQIESAVKNNDFEAFKTAIQSRHSGIDNDEQKPQFNDNKAQEHFNELVEYYTENRKLPEMGKGFGLMGDRGNMGNHGPRGQKEMR